MSCQTCPQIPYFLHPLQGFPEGYKPKKFFKIGIKGLKCHKKKSWNVDLLEVYELCLRVIQSCWIVMQIVMLLAAACQVEDGRGSGCPHPFTTRGGAAQTDHRHPQRNVGPARGPLAWLPQHCHQGLRAPVAVPGLSEGGEVRWPHPEGHWAADGSV